MDFGNKKTPESTKKQRALSKIDQLFGESSDSEEQTVGDIASASQLKRALSERQRTVSELINEIQSEEEEVREPLTPILGNSPVLENSDNSQFFPSPQDWYSSGSEKNRPVNPREGLK